MIIQKYVVHVLDPGEDAPILNDYECKNYVNVDKFIKKIIKKVNNNSDTVKAKYKDSGELIVNRCCLNIFEDNRTFLQNSKEMASYLFDLMKENKNSKKCNLIIVLYSVEQIQNIMIAKLDYKNAYNQQIYFENDKLKINVIENENTISETIKQCAIVESPNLANLYDLKILEKENSTKSEFFSGFLEADLIKDDTYKTRCFIDITNMHINADLENMKQRENILNKLHNILDIKSSIDVEEFINETNINENIKKDLEEWEIEKFNVDKEVVEKKFKTRTIKTSTGFKISGKSAGFENNSKYEIKENTDGTIDIILKGIKFFKDI